jgi:hypothetical protein
MVSLVHARAGIGHLKGGTQRKMTGHFLAVIMSPGDIAAQLPRGPNALQFRIVIASALTKLQLLVARYAHIVRRNLVRDLILFFRENNLLYACIQLNREVLNFLDDEQPLFEYQKGSEDSGLVPLANPPSSVNNSDPVKSEDVQMDRWARGHCLFSIKFIGHITRCFEL